MWESNIISEGPCCRKIVEISSYLSTDYMWLNLSDKNMSAFYTYGLVDSCSTITKAESDM